MRFAAKLAAALVLCAATTHACSIPVFRYALDRWPADRYTLEIAPADAAEPKVAHFMRNFTDSTPLNLRIERLSEDSPGPSRLRTPGNYETTRQVWSGKLDSNVISALSDSPARQEIVRRILAGESAVWVLVTSGKSETDAAIATRLEKRLRYLEQIAQIPPIDPNDPSSRLGPGPKLGVKFSMLRVSADDVAEQAFLAMLAGPNGDEMGNHGIWLAPVFGRGRVLGSWGARDFGDEQIDELCLFLLGACSCQVKQQNPGWDLLLNTDWDASLQALGTAEIDTAAVAPVPPEPARPAASAATPAPVETVTIAPPAASPAPEIPRPATTRLPLLSAAGALLALGLGLTWWSMRKRP